MISLYLRPDKTQVVKAEINKKKIFEISLASEVSSYWDSLTGGPDPVVKPPMPKVKKDEDVPVPEKKEVVSDKVHTPRQVYKIENEPENVPIGLSREEVPSLSSLQSALAGNMNVSEEKEMPPVNTAPEQEIPKKEEPSAEKAEAMPVNDDEPSDISSFVFDEPKGKEPLSEPPVAYVPEVKEAPEPEPEPKQKPLIFREMQSENNLNRLFTEVSQLTKIRNEEIYIVLPDFLFDVIDCVPDHGEKDIEKIVSQRISDLTNKGIEQFYYSVPIKSKPADEQFITIYAIDRRIIQRIIDAAAEENITLTSVEPASVSFLRCQANFTEETFILESFKNHAVMLSFSILGGVFGIDIPDLAENRLFYEPHEDAESDLLSAIVQQDMLADNLFPSLNFNIPYAVLSENRKRYKDFAPMAERLAEDIHFPSFVEANGISELEWMPVIGTMMQKYKEIDEIYFDKPSYLVFGSANVLPKQIQTTAKLQQVKQSFKNVCRGLLATGTILLAAEVFGILYFGSAEIPNGLQADYKDAKGRIDTINTEIKVIKEASEVDANPVEGFTAMQNFRPENLFYTKMTIGDRQKGAQNKKKPWITTEMVAPDPLLFQEFISSLSDADTFSSVSLTQINSNTMSGFKTATVVLKKGGARQNEK